MSFFLANTITGAAMSFGIYLVLLNFLIGLCEGELIRRWFFGKRRATWWMIAANYFSAWVGSWILEWILEPRIYAWLGDRPIERVNRAAMIIVGCAFGMTLIFEAGFVWAAIEPGKRSIRRVIGATLVVNFLSYIFICGWFIAMSFSLPLNASVVDMRALGKISGGTLYWVDLKGNLMAREMNGDKGDRVVTELMRNDFICPRQLRLLTEEPNENRVELDVIYGETIWRDKPKPKGMVAPEFLVLDVGRRDAFPENYWDQDRMLLKNVLDTRSKEKRKSMRVSYDWYRHFLKTQCSDGSAANLFITMAIMDFKVEEPTVMPDDKIVFAWCDEVVIFDPHTKRLAVVGPGTCPAFVPNGE